MSGFTALNVEPEDNFEEEIDDTKEIQIEEAFKLYQNALKLHSQGPKFFDVAEAAYDELFQSEVFKYPEAVTDYGHEQLDDVVALPVPAHEQTPLPVLPANAADSAANSLPQLIYLSYKNRGQFVLDVARHQLKVAPVDRRSTCLYYYKYCLQSLEDSASALERDDTDLDLWKKSARISDVLYSQRLVRFCLESVVAGDDETGDQIVDLSGLDEAFANGELLQVLKLIQDEVATGTTSATQARDDLLQLLVESNDPFPFLPPRASKLEYLYQNQRPNQFDVRRSVVDLRGETQAALADAFARSFGIGSSTDSGVDLGAIVSVSLPSSLEDKLPLTALQQPVTVTAQTVEAEIQPSTQPDKSNSVSPAASAQSPASYHSAPDEVQPDLQGDESNSKESRESPSEQEVAVQVDGQSSMQDFIQPEVRLPTRKRSSTAAGNEEPESRVKSKRLRARESLLEIAAQEEEVAQENDYYVREQLAIIEDADLACVTYVNKIFAKFGIDSLTQPESLEIAIESRPQSEASVPPQPMKGLLEDVKEVTAGWTEELSTAIMSGHSSRDIIEKSGGMALFQRHLKASLPKKTNLEGSQNDDEMMINFAQSLSQSHHTLADAAILWLTQLLTTNPNSGQTSSSYLRGIWPYEMKINIMYVVLQIDAILLEHIQARCDRYGSLSDPTKDDMLSAISQTAELVLTIFELHLDEYYGMIMPESQADETKRTEQRDRLQRWAHCTTTIMQLYFLKGSIDERGPLVLRYILMSAVFASVLADNDKAHVLICLNSARAAVEEAGCPVIALPNNRAMPQVSTTAIDQEVSRLSTLDFFNSIFESDNSDPVATIMKLEPILEPQETIIVENDDQSVNVSHQKHVTELTSFLNSGDASLKLFLWRRLQNGYSTISYTPKVISCLLRSLETVVNEIKDQRHRSMTTQDRQIEMFRWLRDADEITVKVLSKVSDDSKAFECLNDDHLSKTISAIAFLLDILYQFVRYDDSVRVGRTTPPSLRTNTAMKMYDKGRDKLRDAFVRGWTLLYHLLKEATTQLPELFERPIDEMAEYLRLVHNTLGHRQYCKQCNKAFIKLAKNELLSTRSEVDYSQDVAQILFDMYQVRLGTGFGDANHGCSADQFGRDKETAFNLVPVIMNYTRKLNMRELIKSDLKSTVEKIQHTLGQAKASPALSANRKVVSAFLKSLINPQDIYMAVKGIGDLVMKPVQGEYAKVAAQGWYKMLGMMSIAKYKSVKRVSPTPADDLDTASTFLKMDLEYSIEDWETWYRLAQVFDCKIEDSLIWNALKINDSRAEIATLERGAINAYTMAMAVAMRSADDNPATVQKLSDMFSEFAFRLYASSRPPLGMEAFNTDKHIRHLSSSKDQSMSKAPFILPWKPYAVWKFAVYLLQRKFATGQKQWLCYYTLGKCLWKMHQHEDNSKATKPVKTDDVLDTFTDAVELVPTKEKSSDYILEPHYKLVSVVHKLVTRNLVSPEEGFQHLQATQFARAVHVSRDETGDIEWEPYILEVLRKLGHADKSNWHHRITARAAHVNYDGDRDIAGALAARHQFTQQIFTKTMTMQVWKPEYERPGRHYVYTGRYLAFFVHLLDLLNDRASLEQLVRRIRRKTTDFLDHPKVWENTALTYVKLLRRLGKVPDGFERRLFEHINYDDFAKMSERVEKWAHDPENTSAYQDVVQDAIELKKLNNSLMKGPAIDDLIGDAYACMYDAFVSQLPPEEAPSLSVSALPQGTFINMNTDIVPSGDDNLDRLRLHNLISGQSDGATTISTSAALEAVVGEQTSRAGTPLVDPIRIPTPSKPGRTKTITRREVQRKAEACIVKAAAVKTPILTKRPFIDLPSRRDSNFSNIQDDTDKDKSHIDEDRPDGSRASSRRLSVSLRDSAGPDERERDVESGIGDDNDGEADDESELTDLDNDGDEDDEDVPKDAEHTRSPYHSLMNRKRKAEDDGGDVDEDSNDEDRENLGEDEGEEDNEGDESGADRNRDDMELDDVEDTALEIQDSQEPPRSAA